MGSKNVKVPKGDKPASPAKAARGAKQLVEQTMGASPLAAAKAAKPKAAAPKAKPAARKTTRNK